MAGHQGRPGGESFSNLCRLMCKHHHRWEAPPWRRHRFTGVHQGLCQFQSQRWSSLVSTLSEIAKSQPHAAFSALTHGLQSKWTYLSRVIPNIRDELSPLDDVLRSKLHPALTGRPPPNDLEYALFALPTRLYRRSWNKNPLQSSQ